MPLPLIEFSRHFATPLFDAPMPLTIGVNVALHGSRAITARCFATLRDAGHYAMLLSLRRAIFSFAAAAAPLYARLSATALSLPSPDTDYALEDAATPRVLICRRTLFMLPPEVERHAIIFAY